MFYVVSSAPLLYTRPRDRLKTLQIKKSPFLPLFFLLNFIGICTLFRLVCQFCEKFRLRQDRARAAAVQTEQKNI